jgi:uncharacterized repeat protein (TIGR03943 family)
MFICNLKINKKNLVKFLLIIFIIIALVMFAWIFSKVFMEIKEASSKDSTTKVSDTIPSPEIANITSDNYTNILKEVHENMDKYIGQKISFTGYVYRVSDLEDNQFIIARDMVINSKGQTVVVGFLCKYDNASDFEDNTWIKITGEIQKGFYYGDIPIIEIQEIEKAQMPDDATVMPPSDSYVPTAVIY